MTNRARSQSTEAHTPGPWVEFGDQGETIAIMPAGRPGDICTFAPPYPSRADARLISAAPDLLEALLMISALVERLSWLKDNKGFIASRETNEEIIDEMNRLRAINEELLMALENILAWPFWPFSPTMIARAKAAIAKAKGGA